MEEPGRAPQLHVVAKTRTRLSDFTYYKRRDFLGGASGKEPAYQCRRLKRHGFHPGSGRSPGGGNGTPLRYSCLENPMDRGVWPATVMGSQRVGHDGVSVLNTFLALLSGRMTGRLRAGLYRFESGCPPPG